MRVPSGRRTWAEEIRHRIERMERLPLRPSTARQLIAAFPDPDDPESDESRSDILQRAAVGESGRNRPAWELDPGWVLSRGIDGPSRDPLAALAELPWWPLVTSSGASEAIQKLWRHSVAVALAARWLAREAGDPSPERLVEAGLLHNLGLWAVTAADPEWLVRWLDDVDPESRLHREQVDLGEELTNLGRRLTTRWNCDPLVVDSTWLHAPRDSFLRRAASDPDRIAIIQESVRWAEMTPWALAPPPEGLRDQDWDHPTADPRLRILVAEVQSRCGSPFIAPDATPIEEKMTRQNASLRVRLSEARQAQAACERFLTTFAGSDPAQSPNDWADSAARTWCAEPAVTAASIVWNHPSSASQRPGDGATSEQGLQSSEVTGKPLASPAPPDLVIPLGGPRQPHAEIRLWCEPTADASALLPACASETLVRAWEAWAARVADRSSLEQRLRQVLRAHREGVIQEEGRVRQLKIDALAEFAAGAGHEINNPLAVIVGRSQLLLARAEDPEQARSLRIIMGQAQRAHRILRDLMFFARPPAPRLRPCRPSELLRSSISDFQDECAARGIKLSSQIDNPEVEIQADPDALRHLAEILIRNAIQATPSGGSIRVQADVDPHEARWTIADSGSGITPAEGAHLFDPFFCGRQAGRGLGLGLPRASRIVALGSGQLRWSSEPGHGSIFRVHLPRAQGARPPRTDGAASAKETAHESRSPLPNG